MSLQVWLPLTKDLRQQGLSNVTATNNGATYLSSGGKLGGTYSATASGQTITINFANLSTMLANGKTYTLTCWVKPTGTPNSGWVIKLGDNSCGLWWAKSEARWVWNENDNGKRCANPTISADYTNWHHLAIVVDKTVSGKITTQQYVDGVLATGYPGSTWDCSSHSQPAGTIITISPYVSQLNDIRLYDHCLSQMEVKKLSQGLILHYPLNRQGWGQENLVTGSNTNSTSTNSWAIGSQTGGNTKTIEQDETGTYCVKFVRDSTAQSGWYYLSYGKLLRNQIKTDTTYTLTFDCKASVNSSITFTGLLNGNATNYMTNSTTNIQSSVVANQWCHMKYQCKTISSFDGITIGSQVVYLAPQAALKAVGVTVYFKNIKLEEGSIATPWCPNSSDALATTMGLNGTTEYDCSGFCNNGTRTGTFTWTSDTPKYQVSTKFSQSRIQCNGDFLYGLSTATLSAWVKLTAYHSERCMVIYANGRYLTINNSGQLSGYSYGKTPAGYYNSNQTIPLNTWTHITIVWDDTTWYFYINGILVNSWACTGTFTNVGSYASVGQESNGGRSVSGLISDVRIYATALSADDVKSLYQNCATIDLDGTIRGQIRS